MSTNIAEMANRLADLMEKGLECYDVDESHEYFLWPGAENRVSACALGMAVVGKEGSAKGALDNWRYVNLYHTAYAAEVLDISVSVASRISNDHARNLTTTEQIIERLRNKPETYFY